jgi:fatty acid-binding protein DegV
MKIGTILKATFIAGAATGAVGTLVLKASASGATKAVQKVYKMVKERVQKETSE